MTYQTVQPRILPRRLSDAALGLAIGLVQFFVFLVLMLIPTLAVGILTQNAIAAALTFMALFVFTSILILLFTVRHLRCDAEGLEFVRVLGTPKKLSWADVISIEEAPQAEVVLHGWLWPGIPPREATSSLTSLGHYRISWQGGTAYFPPNNVQQFLYAIHAATTAAPAQANWRESPRSEPGKPASSQNG
jgi:hypothetical protein